MSKMYTPWGEAQSVRQVVRGVRTVSTAGHGGVVVSKKLAETRLPKTALQRGIIYGGAYWFEEDLDWLWPAIVITGDLASCSYDELLEYGAGVAVRYGYQDVYVDCCVAAGVGAETAKKNMRVYVETECVESVRRNILKYADDFDATGKRGWVEGVHDCVYGVAELFRKNGISANSARADIFRVGKELLASGAVVAVQNYAFLRYGYNVDDQFLPVFLFNAA